MKEDFPKTTTNKEAPIDELIESFESGKIALARELSEGNETFSFPGITTETYSKIKSLDEEFPGLTTPIDELIRRFESEGIKVVLGETPESGNIYILPSQSNNIEEDGIFPRQLQDDRVTDDRLKKLISMDR